MVLEQAYLHTFFFQSLLEFEPDCTHALCIFKENGLSTPGSWRPLLFPVYTTGRLASSLFEDVLNEMPVWRYRLPHSWVSEHPQALG